MFIDKKRTWKCLFVFVCCLERIKVHCSSILMIVPVFLTNANGYHLLGYDVIEWLMEKLNIEDGTEALHLASLLCQNGYIFPVADTKSLAVKDDGTLYRFQVRLVLI